MNSSVHDANKAVVKKLRAALYNFDPENSTLAILDACHPSAAVQLAYLFLLYEVMGVVTNLSGPSDPAGASWADIRYFGITSDADTDAAEQFVDFSMNDGYAETLSIAPEGKFPVRRGTPDDPTKFTTLWATLPVGVDRKAPLKDLYAPAVIEEITKGLDTAQRWGVEDGQLALASKMLNSQEINRVVREYIDGGISAEDAVKKMNDALSKIN